MEYQVVKRIHIDKSRCKKVGQFYYDPIQDGIYIEGAFPFPVQVMISEGLNKTQVTPGFLKLPFILRGWINLDITLREIDLLKMLCRQKLMFHASCVDDTMIVGFPNSGKTYQTYKMIKDGGKLISEEYTIVENGIASPYKNTSRSCFSARTITDAGLKLSARERVQLAMTTARAAVMPFMFEAVIWKEMEVSGDRAKVKRIVYGSTGEEVKDYKKLIILTENEFPYMANDILQAYALCSNLDLIGFQNMQRKLIKGFVDGIYFNSCAQVPENRCVCSRDKTHTATR